MLKRLPLLCIAIAASAACVLISSEAQAKGCNDHFLSKVYSGQSRGNEIPKTRRVSSRRKKVAPASMARSVPKAAFVEQTVRLPAAERPYEPDVIEELDLEWLSFDVTTDDPRKNAVPRLLYNRFSLGMAIAGDPSPIVSAPFVARPLFHTPMPLRL